MVEFLRGKASERKLKFFAAASFRHLAYLLPDSRQHRGIEMLEQEAEGKASLETMREVTRDVRHALPASNFIAGDTGVDDPYYIALMLYRELVSSSLAVHALHATAGLADSAAEERVQCSLLRDIFGNPFYPISLDPAILAWNDCRVRKIAQGVYDEGAFDNLPILADALEEAGCQDADLLTHCRQPRLHVRGCWVVDLLLGKS
jgi:hypothetical protein